MLNWASFGHILTIYEPYISPIWTSYSPGVFEDGLEIIQNGDSCHWFFLSHEGTSTPKKLYLVSTGANGLNPSNCFFSKYGLHVMYFYVDVDAKFILIRNPD